MLAVFAFATPTAAQTTVNWNFVGDTGNMGNGQLTYGSDGIVTAFSGTYQNQALSLISFTSDPNNPGGGGLGNNNNDGTYTYHGVPNTRGADYIFDDKFPLTVNGILVSTGEGMSERVYDPSLTDGVPDFFSINPDGSYVHDFGRFTTSAFSAPVPEPATWAMMMLGFGLAGYGVRRQYRRAEAKFDDRIKRIASGDLIA